VGRSAELANAKYGSRALKALLRDRRPDLVRSRKSPTQRRRQVLGAARRFGIPVVLFTHQNVALDQDGGHWNSGACCAS